MDACCKTCSADPFSTGASLDRLSLQESGKIIGIHLTPILGHETTDGLSFLRAIPNMFLSVSQEVHARMSALSCAIERASPGACVVCDLLLMVDTVPAQHKPLLIHGGVQHQRSVSDSPGSAISTSHVQGGVVRIRNKVQRGTWLVSNLCRRTGYRPILDSLGEFYSITEQQTACDMFNDYDILERASCLSDFFGDTVGLTMCRQCAARA